MERRNFLKGLLVGTSAAASTALVKLASPADVQALTVGRPASLSQPELECPYQPYGCGEYVYMKDRAGSFKPIGIVTEVTLTARCDEVAHWDGTIHLVPTGLRDDQMRFQGPYVR